MNHSRPFLMFSVAFVFGCDRAALEAETSTVQTLTSGTQADLLSAGTCELQSNKMTRCRVPTRDLTSTAIDTAVNLRTVFTSTSSGNCSTWYPLTIALTVQGEPPVSLQYNAPTQAVLRRRDGAAIAQITLADTSRWTSVATFDPSCRLGLNVVWNEPDVNTRAEAEAVVASLEDEVTKQTKIRDRYQALMLYHQAFELMNEVATNFWTSLTNPTMQELRDKAKQTKTTLFNMIGYCVLEVPPDDPNPPPALSEDDRMNLLELYASMSALGSPEAFRKPTGEMMSLGEYLGEEASTVLSTVEKLTVSGGADYAADYAAASEATVRASLKLARAQEQLAAWLVP